MLKYNKASHFFLSLQKTVSYYLWPFGRNREISCFNKKQAGGFTEKLQRSLLQIRRNHMGQKDTVTKDYIRNAEVFADAFNYLLYEGEKIIMPESLHELDPAATAVVYGDNLKAEPVQRYRDSLKYMTAMERDDVVYMILGIENQSHVHYAMPVKNMLYDAMEYANQVRKTSVRYRKEKSTGNTKSEKNNSGKTSSGEFLTGFSRSDELIPVVTLVIYFGTEAWGGPRSLYEMFGVENKKILPFVPDYRINLIAPEEMSEQEINRFHTDLREVLLYIKYSKEKEKLVDLIQTDDGFQNMKTETVVMLNTLTNSKLKFNEEKEETSMCLAIDELREEAKQEGIEFGRRELIEKMLMNHETMDKIKEYTGYTQEKIDEIAKELSAR